MQRTWRRGVDRFEHSDWLSPRRLLQRSIGGSRGAPCILSKEMVVPGNHCHFAIDPPCLDDQCDAWRLRLSKARHVQALHRNHLLCCWFASSEHRRRPPKEAISIKYRLRTLSVVITRDKSPGWRATPMVDIREFWGTISTAKNRPRAAPGRRGLLPPLRGSRGEGSRFPGCRARRHRTTSSRGR